MTPGPCGYFEILCFCCLWIQVDPTIVEIHLPPGQGKHLSSAHTGVIGASALDRVEWIQGQTLEYLKKVLRSSESISKIGCEGLLNIFDRVSRARTSIANSRESSNTTIELISNISLAKCEKKAVENQQKSV